MYFTYPKPSLYTSYKEGLRKKSCVVCILAIASQICFEQDFLTGRICTTHGLIVVCTWKKCEKKETECIPLPNNQYVSLFCGASFQTMLGICGLEDPINRINSLVVIWNLMNYSMEYEKTDKLWKQNSQCFDSHSSHILLIPFPIKRPKYSPD